MKNVLIVDDNDINLMILEEILLDYNINLYQALNGVEALQLVRKLTAKNIKIDLIITDINMPVMCGFEFSSTIRKEFGYDIPIVAASTGDENKKHCHKHGIDKFFQKPFNMNLLNEYLCEKLNKVLQIAA